jgi:hypothetical protein
MIQTPPADTPIDALPAAITPQTEPTSLQSAAKKLRDAATSLAQYHRFHYIAGLHPLLRQAAEACEIYQPSDHPTAHGDLCQTITSATSVLGSATSKCSHPELAVALRNTGLALACALSAWANNPPSQ